MEKLDKGDIWDKLYRIMSKGLKDLDGNKSTVSHQSSDWVSEETKVHI